VAQLLSFLKADAMLRTNVGATIMQEFMENKDIKILSFEERSVGAELSVEHYAHVANRPFYPWLERYVTACPVYVMLVEVEGDEAVKRLRAFLGKTISHLADPDTIRGRFGPYAGVNCVHLSDSVASGEVETALWKERLGIAEGSFDIPMEDFIKRYDSALPEHTPAIRELCITIAEAEQANEAQEAQIRVLLEQECKGVSTEDLDRLASTIVGSCLN
jgi:nucleoside-diphosphate kinase